jgi:glycerol-3-phosphate dehydrogenase
MRNQIYQGAWSSSNRMQVLEHGQNETFDLIVIGGGITGAGILLDAASRGMNAILFEKDDFASGTSSRSTKLIHGGLRYLKQLEFKVVRDVGKERSIAQRNAPHLVYPEPMLLPIVEGGSLGKLSARLGLFVYEKLAGVKADEKFKMLSQEEILKKEPLLNPNGLLGGAVYTEYRTDDARLCISIFKTAISHGGKAVNHCKVVDFLKTGGQIVGVLVQERTTGKQFEIKGKVVVNAGGPWVDLVRTMDAVPKGKRLHLTQGIHLVFDAKRFPLKQSVYFDTKDGRMIFAIPRENKVYLGTTDTNFHGSPNDTAICEEDATYLINAFNDRFTGARLQLHDIESGWAGIRPLIHEDGKSPSELSRKDEIFESESGLLSIAGGKLTGYRVMAEKIVDRVQKKLKRSGSKAFLACKSKSIKLKGGEFENNQEVIEFGGVQLGEAKQIGANALQIKGLVERYGRETEKIVELGYLIWPNEVDKSNVLKKAEILYCMEEESALFPADFWIRRSGGLYFRFEETISEFHQLEHWFMDQNICDELLMKEAGYAFLREADKIKEAIIKSKE